MTYEYLCEACGHKWETEQRISEDPIKDCPHCGEARAKRQISAGGGFILKGGGWYSDLYSSPAPAKADASKSEAKTDSASTAVASAAASDSPSAAPATKKKESSATPDAKGSGSSQTGSSSTS